MTGDLNNFLQQVADHIDRPSYERYVLDNGKLFPNVEVSQDRGKLGECYTNAYYAAEDNDWRYVEGYATSVIPMMHAWCVDDEGVVMEVTWETAGDEYMGVVMNMTDVAKAMVTTGVWGVMANDYLNEFKLLEGSSQ